MAGQSARSRRNGPLRSTSSTRPHSSSLKIGQPRVQKDARVGDAGDDRAEGVGLGDELSQDRRVGGVTHPGEEAVAASVLLKFLESWTVEIERGHPPPIGEELAGDGGSDALRRPGDDGDRIGWTRWVHADLPVEDGAGAWHSRLISQ